MEFQRLFLNYEYPYNGTHNFIITTRSLYSTGLIKHSNNDYSLCLFPTDEICSMMKEIQNRVAEIARESRLIKNVNKEKFNMLKQKEGEDPVMFIKLKTLYPNKEIVTEFYLKDDEAKPYKGSRRRRYNKNNS